MGFQVRKWLFEEPYKYGIGLSPVITGKLEKLDEYFILSRENYLNRVHLVDKIHRKHLNSEGKQKEFAYCHLIAHDGKLWFSSRGTGNNDIESHPIINEIFNKLLSCEEKFKDRKSKEITTENVEYIVDSLISLAIEFR